jgi:hypothetical protein
MVEICSGLVLGVRTKEEDEYRWQWGDEGYSGANVYFSLIEEEDEGPVWGKEVWSPLIPTKLLTFVW